MAIADPGFKREWIAALRSKKYQQVFGTLGGGERVCALGCGLEVAKKICAKTGNDPLHYLTARIPGDERMQIVCMNDANKKSFEYIADHIEQNL